MLKPQDIMLLLKILSNLRENQLSQIQLAVHLCMSQSEVNAGIKRLNKSGLLRRRQFNTTSLKAANRRLETTSQQLYLPIVEASEEFLIYGLKYVFPVQLGEYTRGIATSYAAPIFAGKIHLGEDPIPVWPFEEGTQRGLELEPLYTSVPKSLTLYPDQNFYDLLALIDAIRQGRARERELAIKILRERLKHDEQSKFKFSNA